ncbi:Hsp20 family protein [uncultured Phenylobacterium sp.]|uniref:Hsp20 family protein n=1 Tax=uncultured Phenylobacterium sp. TaxID=349273 RepID=UPI0025E9337B|nr:Hsp20 family protein [uncultured Phenylobacterium sp.]
MRTAYDLSPFYRSMIGVDRLSDLVEAAVGRDEGGTGPSYDVQKTGEDAYRITLATPGFAQDDLEITTQPNLLIVTGRPAAAGAAVKAGSYLHRGIVAAAFERRFGLADHVVVRGARYEHGLLSIDLVREAPDALKPRRIEIRSERPFLKGLQGLKPAAKRRAPALA